MVKVLFNGQVIAEADTADLQMVEGNRYFPPASLKKEFFKATNLHTTCAWKGVASYETIAVGDKSAKDAAWHYPTPSAAAAKIKDYRAFYAHKVQFAD